MYNLQVDTYKTSWYSLWIYTIYNITHNIIVNQTKLFTYPPRYSWTPSWPVWTVPAIRRVDNTKSIRTSLCCSASWTFCKTRTTRGSVDGPGVSVPDRRPDRTRRGRLNRRRAGRSSGTWISAASRSPGTSSPSARPSAANCLSSV